MSEATPLHVKGQLIGHSCVVQGVCFLIIPGVPEINPMDTADAVSDPEDWL